MANIVPVIKKNGSVQICINFRNINEAYPKDNFPLPFINQVVDQTVRFGIMSLMDGFLGYNQILIAPEDRHKTSFTMPWGTFSYKVMPFGLKNASATYQRAMYYAFHDLINTIVQAYVDDFLALSRHRSDHLANLRVVLER